MGGSGKSGGGGGRGRGPKEEPPSSKKARYTVESKVQQKITENLKFLTPSEIDIVTDPVSKQTCRQRMEADLRLKDAGDCGKNTSTHTQNTHHMYFKSFCFP